MFNGCRVQFGLIWLICVNSVCTHGVPPPFPCPSLQVEYARSWVDQHLAHLMPHPPAGYTMEQQNSMERLHKTATYILEVITATWLRDWGGNPGV